MARPIWRGTLSFGLLHVPVSLMPGERRTDLSFRMLDSRDKSPIRYERVNAETGEEVPWNQIVKAYEYDKGSYVVLEEDDLRAASPEGREAVDVEAFVDATQIAPRYFEKPYVLVPDRKAEKGYVLLRETLAATRQAGIARVVIRTREYLSAVLPQGAALVLILLRFPQELVEPEEYKLPEGSLKDYRIAQREMDMARQLIESMSAPWAPDDYRDEFRDRLHAVIEKRLKRRKGVVAVDDDSDSHSGEHAATNVVDFMSLLEKSIQDNRRTPAGKPAANAGAKTDRRPRGKPANARKTAAKKTAAKKAADGEEVTRKPAKAKPAKAGKKPTPAGKASAKSAKKTVKPVPKPAARARKAG